MLWDPIKFEYSFPLLWEGINTNCINGLQMKIVSIYNCYLLIPPSVLNDLSLTVLSADVGSDFCLSLSLQRCFTLMDRGFTFKLISNYINMITATDSKVKKKHFI